MFWSFSKLPSNFKITCNELKKKLKTQRDTFYEIRGLNYFENVINESLPVQVILGSHLPFMQIEFFCFDSPLHV